MSESTLTGPWCFVENKFFNYFIFIAIIVNSIVLAIETAQSLSLSTVNLLQLIDGICIGIFVIEALCKLAAYRLRYFKSGWNWFDFIIVVIALLPVSHYFSVFRALRVIRAFKVIEHIPALKRVTDALMHAIPGLIATASLLLLVFFVFGVASTQLYAAEFPQWFGHLGRSMFTLFQIMTLESWSMGIVRPIMATHPYAWLLFIPFILISAFILLNFLIGIVVDAIAHLKRSKEQQDGQSKLEARLERIEALLITQEKKT